MGIKFNEKTKSWDVSFHKRHPITRLPVRSSRVGIKTEAEAKRVYAQLIVQTEDKLKEKTIPRWWTTVENFKRVSLEKGMTIKTVENYYVCLKAHTFDIWKSRRIDSITTEEIRQLLRERVGNRSLSHQKNVLKFIRGVFKYAMEAGLINRNPTPEMKFRIGDKIRRVLTEPQVKTLLERGKQYNWEWYEIVATAIYTGMRSGELHALTWDKVNLDERTILVDCSWNKVDGFKSTKSGDDRIVEIAPNLLLMLKELKLQNTDSNFVLPRLSRWDEGDQAAALRMFLVGIGLPEIRFHDLRATWATLMLSKGVEPAKVMTMGGWREIKTMMVYMRKAGIDIRGITNCLNLHNPSKEPANVIPFEIK